VLIVSESLGGGHAKAGQCVATALKDLAPDWEVRCVDLSHFAAGWFRTIYFGAYLFAVRHIPWVWGFLYRHPPRRSGGTMPPWLIRLGFRRYKRLVNDYQPDLILATQVTASEVTANLRARGLYRGATATLVTDFDAHPAFRADGIDLFFVPDEDIRQGLVQLGVAPERLEATGIPVDLAFEQDFDVAALKSKHGIRPGVSAVLLMGGSLGLGPLRSAVRALLAWGQPLDLMVVTGHNRRLRKRLKRLQPAGHARLRVFGFIDYVAELMAIADLFVSKPGGLSMTEAVTIGAPTLTIAPIPGHEEANARHLEAKGVVERLKRREPLAGAVERLLADHEARERLGAAARAYARRGAAPRVAARLFELAERHSERPPRQN